MDAYNMSITEVFAGKKTRSSVYLSQVFKNLFVKLASKKSKYNLTTKTGRMCLFAELQNAMDVYFSRSDFRKVLQVFGIETADKLANEIMDNKDFLTSIAGLNLSSLILEKRLTTNQVKGKALVEANGCGTDPYDVNTVSLADVERLVVVRTKYGTHTPKMYTITGALNTKTADNVKAMYSYETGCNYYETRPILYTTWLTLSDEFKNASRPCEEDDLKDAVE